MPRTKIAGIGHHVPENIYTNEDLIKYMDTTNEWIIERTGIEERRFITKGEDTTTTLAAKASRNACKHAGIEPEEIDFIIFATLSPDYYFPGSGVLLQRELGITKTEIGALDIRNQCTGFIYGLSVADQFIKSGMYKNILLVGAEVHSVGLDFSTKGRNVSVIFGDGAGAVILQPTEQEDQGLLLSELHSDGTHAEQLCVLSPGSHSGMHMPDTDFGLDDEKPIGGYFLSEKILEDGHYHPHMSGKLVFKHAVVKFPEVIKSVLSKMKLSSADLDMFIPHQANLRISQFVQKILGLADDKVYNNIQKYGNTTAASIPIALSEAVQLGKVKRGDLVCLAAFGAGFTWGSTLLRW